MVPTTDLVAVSDGRPIIPGLPRPERPPSSHRFAVHIDGCLAMVRIGGSAFGPVHENPM